jgi:hypothetical protein
MIGMHQTFLFDEVEIGKTVLHYDFFLKINDKEHDIFCILLL